MIGWYGPDQNAGFIGAIAGAAILLVGLGMLIAGPPGQTKVTAF